MRRKLIVALPILLGTAWGCNSNVSPQLLRPPQSGDRITLELGGQSLNVEVVFDPTSRALGLMSREQLPEMSGMLFIFPTNVEQGFWMKNTLIPLSIAFLDDAGTILQIENMRPNDESRTWSKHKVRFALEVNKGWFRKLGIGVGDRIEEFAAKVQEFRAR